MDEEEISKASVMDAELVEFLSKHPVPKVDWSNLEKFRATRAGLEGKRLKEQGTPAPGFEEKFRTISMRDGFESRIKIHKPVDTTGPLVVLVFGGGFIVGNDEQLTPLGRATAKAFKATTITISYRLAPEHRFPTPAHDVEDSLLWIASNTSELGADPTKGFVLGGISAGGNLAACVAQKILDDKSLAHPLTGLWLCVPWIFPLDKDIVPEQYKDIYNSREKADDVPVLDKDALAAINRYLSPNASSPLHSPFNSKTPHKGLPPTYIQVCGLDPLRDDGLVYERVLRDNGVLTKLDVWPGVPHAHFAFFPFLAISKQAITDIIMGFNWLLGTDMTAQTIHGLLAPGQIGA